MIPVIGTPFDSLRRTKTGELQRVNSHPFRDAFYMGAPNDRGVSFGLQSTLQALRLPDTACFARNSCDRDSLAGERGVAGQFVNDGVVGQIVDARASD